MIELDLEATSGISGYVRRCHFLAQLVLPSNEKTNIVSCRSISIACWVVVFSPQIIENFRRHSADGLSVVFLLIWLLGDVFNIIGAILQGVLPTMIILAIYYTFADIVLVLQVFYYRGLTLSDTSANPDPDTESAPSETQPLLPQSLNGNDSPQVNSPGDRAARVAFSDVFWTPSPADAAQSPPEAKPGRRMSMAAVPRRRSSGEFGRRLSLSDMRRRMTIADLGRRVSQAGQRMANMDGARLLPTAPLVDAQKDDTNSISTGVQSTSGLHSFFVNTTCILMVCGAGVTGWWIGQHSGSGDGKTAPDPPAYPEFHPLGQVFGYLCTVFYLGSRVPQLLLNFRRKSTEGVSLLFFLFACIGNIAYVLSIFAYSPICVDPDHCTDGEWNAIYARYVLVNLSWIVGSAGTLFLDLLIFWQFFLYKKRKSPELEEDG